VIEALAPGKVVLWGEYAVLTGAPALVMAVERYARCQVLEGGDHWRFQALGFSAPEARIDRAELLAPRGPPPESVWRTVWQVLRRLDCSRLPAGGRVQLDTRSFHQNGSKLGLGSSAAVCVAAYGAFCRLLGQPASHEVALAIHRDLQGGAGSGIDVAAAWYGGTLKFQRAGPAESARAEAWRLPPEIHPTFVWTGRSARTVDHLARFRAWLGRGDRAPLDALAAASEKLFATADPWPDLEAYVAALAALDGAADLGIFSPEHVQLRDLAIGAGVVYKPCGAGGGDLGAAFSPDAGAAQRFVRAAADHGFLLVPLETAIHGFEVTG
jgi:phosphomevalonate kinase